MQTSLRSRLIAAMVAAAGFANFVPARRAMRIDPITALRID